jgi:hypothetical protein
MTGAGNAAAQQPDHCLNNSGAYTVDAGFQYTDANGTWVCAPGSVSASAGGWIRLEFPPTVAPTAMPTPPPAAAARPAKGTKLVDVASVIGIVVAVVAAAGAALAGFRSRRARPVGRLQVHDGPIIRSIDVSKLGSKIRIGTQGDIALKTDGVQRDHAVIHARRGDRNRTLMVLMPRRGKAILFRGGTAVPVVSATTLSDGDEIGIGDARLRFRSIATRPASRWERRTA